MTVSSKNIFNCKPKHQDSFIMEAKEQDELTAVSVCLVVQKHLDQVREQCSDPTDYEQFAELYDMQKSQFLSKFPRHKFFWIKFAEHYAEAWTESAVSFVARAELAHYDQSPPVVVESEALIRDIHKVFEKTRDLWSDNKALWQDNRFLHQTNKDLIKEIKELSKGMEILVEANDALMEANRGFVSTME